MTEQFREFQGDSGAVLIRRDKVTGIRKVLGDSSPFLTGVLVEGQWLFVTDEYETVRDWVLG